MITQASPFVKLIQVICGEGTVFQTFHDSDHSDKSVAKSFYGRLDDEQLTSRLRDLNRRGAGIFYTVNETDGSGRRSRDNIVGINALFADYDKVEPSNLDKLPLPTAIVQSKNGKHIYWKLEPGQDKSKFTEYQKGIARLTGGDIKVNDLPRVMRLPGFNHMKDKNNPFLVRIVEINPDRVYRLNDFNLPEEPSSTRGKGITPRKAPSTATIDELRSKVEGYRAKWKKVRGIGKQVGESEFLKLVLEKVTQIIRPVLNTATHGVDGNDKLLRASRNTAWLLLADKIGGCVCRGSINIGDVVEHILVSAEEIYKLHSSTRWDESKSRATIIRGLGYGIDRKLSDIELESKNIKGASMCDMRFISDAQIDYKKCKVTGIQSVMGTGKTTLMTTIIENYQRENPDNRITVLVHKTALCDQWLGSLSRLGFVAYNNSEVIKRSEDIYKRQYLIATYDSLIHLVGLGVGNGSLSPGLLILDEVDQAFNYLLLCKDTSISNNRRYCWEGLNVLVRLAHHVLVASADLSETEVTILKRLMGKDNNSQYIINQAKVSPKDYYKVNSEIEALQKVEELIKLGKNVYVSSDSATKCETYYRKLLKTYPDIKAVYITAKSKNKYNIKDVNEFVKDYQVVIASPAWGSGIDISNAHFHSVVGIYMNEEDLAYQDCLQSASRVRYPIDNEVYIFIKNNNRWFETDKDKLKVSNNIITNALVPFVIGCEAEKDQMVIKYHKDHGFIQDMQAEYISKSNRCKSFRHYKFWQSISVAGHNIIELQSTIYDSTQKEYEDNIRATSKEIKEETAEIISQSMVIEEGRAELLINKKRACQGKISEEEDNALTRFYISSGIYRDSIDSLSKEDVQWYLYSNGKKVVKALKLLNMTREEAIYKDISMAKLLNEDGGYDAKYYTRDQSYLIRLLASLGSLIRQGEFSQDDLVGFNAVVRDIGEDEVRKLGIKVNVSNPCVTASALLRLCGFTIESKQVRLAKGCKTSSGSTRKTVMKLSMDQWTKDLVMRYLRFPSPLGEGISEESIKRLS